MRDRSREGGMGTGQISNNKQKGTGHGTEGGTGHKQTSACAAVANDRGNQFWGRPPIGYFQQMGLIYL